MKLNNQSTGKQGETLAVDFLKKNKYKIIEQNFHSRWGEIDIIGYNEKTICFIEVKTRTNTEFGRPEESVTRAKQLQIIRTARYYLKRKKIPDNIPCRFDVISIILREPSPEISIIKNAFI
jgi:putative endonuclease